MLIGPCHPYTITLMDDKYVADTTGLKFSSGNTSKKIAKSLNQASRVAELSTYKFKHGAVIKKGGSVIAVGVNRNRNDPTLVDNPRTDASVHAEISAIRAAKGADLRGATIYVARILKNGEQAMSRPCANCIREIRKSGIRKIYYTIDGEMDV